MCINITCINGPASEQHNPKHLTQIIDRARNQTQMIITTKSDTT